VADGEVETGIGPVLVFLETIVKWTMKDDAKSGRDERADVQDVFLFTGSFLFTAQGNHGWKRHTRKFFKNF